LKNIEYSFNIPLWSSRSQGLCLWFRYDRWNISSVALAPISFLFWHRTSHSLTFFHLLFLPPEKASATRNLLFVWFCLYSECQCFTLKLINIYLASGLLVDLAFWITYWKKKCPQPAKGNLCLLNYLFFVLVLVFPSFIFSFFLSETFGKNSCRVGQNTKQNSLWSEFCELCPAGP